MHNNELISGARITISNVHTAAWGTGRRKNLKKFLPGAPGKNFKKLAFQVDQGWVQGQGNGCSKLKTGTVRGGRSPANRPAGASWVPAPIE
jgi:hypothetical protein